LTAIRNIKWNLSFSLINIMGLAFGFTLVIFLIVWLQFELSFDRFNEKADRIFRVTVEFKNGNSSDYFANTQAPLGEYLIKNIPEITDYVRLGSYGNIQVKNENEQYRETIDLADPSIFRVFSFRLLSGNAGNALNNPGSIVISKSKASKYFGNIDPVGRTLLIGKNQRPYTVTGVMEDIPINSQIQADFLIPFGEERNNMSWEIWNYTTYILAQNKNSFEAINKELPEIVKGIPAEDKFQLHIQPLLRIHLHSKLRGDFPNNSNIKTVYILSSILILVLLIACINYINLSTVRYTKKGKETGLRKVAGASNKELAGHFLFESLVIVFIASLIAISICWILIPLFNSLTGIQLGLKSLLNLNFLLKFFILVLLVTVVAGAYPAFVLTSVNPAFSIRNDLRVANITPVNDIRKGLVIFQFIISIALISCTLTIKIQESFIKKKNIGLSYDNVIVIPVSQEGVKANYELFKKDILSNPSVKKVSATNYSPGAMGYYQNVWWEDLPEDNRTNMMDWIPADQDFINTLGIELQRGEFITGYISRQTQPEYVLNETAVKEIGWDNPIGKQMDIIGKGIVVGVVKDFNFKSLYTGIRPVAIAFYPDLFDKLFIKVSANNIPGTIAFLNQKWQSFFPQYPFEYSFLSDDFARMYQKDLVTDRIITTASLIALVISCIGLFGMVLLTIESRIKEIGIRKVNGSTSWGITSMLNFEYIKWITISFIISCPLSYFFMQKWLENFAYKIDLRWWIFALAWLLTASVSMLTVSWNTLRVAIKNPVDCLRHE